jgi:hypothetical protein
VINLRYHIVSITAVFLALGIGITMGSTFLGRGALDRIDQNVKNAQARVEATQKENADLRRQLELELSRGEALNRNLTDIEQQNDELEQTNRELSGLLSAGERLEAGLREQGLDQLLDGRLSQVPVLLLTSAGIEGEVVESAEAALVAAGAELAGVVTVTERFALDDPGELDDLRAILGLSDGEEDQLRVAVTRRLRTLLAAAAAPEPPVDAPDGPVPMPPLVQQLLDGGFLELDATDGPPAGFALLPASGLRILSVSGAGADVADTDFLLPLLDGLGRVDPTQPSAAPPVVVAAQPTVPDEGGTDAEDEEIDPVPFVGPIRDDDELRPRLSTVDHVDSFAGLVAAILALQHGADGQVGHYGVADGAQSLLPLPPDAGG